MEIQRDGNGHPYIEWEQYGIEGMAGVQHPKRAWVQHRTGERDWAGTGRYLNVVRCNDPGHPGGNPTDFPIYNDALPDEQILTAFVCTVNAITGCTPNEDRD